MMNYFTVLNDFFFTQVKGNVLSTYKGNQETSPHGQAGGNYRCKDAVAFVFRNSKTPFEVKSTFMDFRVQPFAHASKADGFNPNGEYIILPSRLPFSANYLNFSY